MSTLNETDISKAIIKAHHKKLMGSIVSDVLIAGAGPSGMTAAVYLAQKGFNVTLLEKRLSTGGGIWGGGMTMSEAVVQENALPLLEEMAIRSRPTNGGLYTVDSIELAVGLGLKAIQSGATIFNLMTVEDVSVHQRRVTGAVVNRSMIADALPVDPITFSAKAVVDATGHDAAVVDTLRKRGLLADSAVSEKYGEGPMDAASGEDFVVENVSEVFPGLWVSGMSVCTAFGGPRMGPIFGGMLLSGKRVAELISSALAESDEKTS